MLTRRGWWLLFIAVILTLFGVGLAAGWTSAIPVLGLSLLIGMAFEWCLFQSRVYSAVGRIRIERQLMQGGRPVPVIWAGMSASVRFSITLESPFRIPFAWIEDRIPAGFQNFTGAASFCGELIPYQPIVLEYTITPPLPGLLRFEGVTIRIADLAGLFFKRLFVRDACEFLVMPALRDEEGKHRSEKRINTLPPPGAHRLRRSGGGSELLDLRDYIPGDPPKTIAWKVSARRDKLITKEFENDVPVRCVVFLDTSDGMRVGPHWSTPIAKLADCAAAIAQAATAHRDLIGLTTFDESDFKILPPARTTTHKLRILRTMSESASLMPALPQLDIERLVKASLSVAGDVYPDLLDSKVNTLPKKMYWLPLSDQWWGWMVLPLIFAPAISAIVFFFFSNIANQFLQLVNRIAPNGLGWLFCLIAIMLLPFIGYQIWFWHGIRGFFSSRRIRTRERKQLGLVFAALDSSGPGTVERTIWDDHFVCVRANRFLTDHHVRLTPTLLDNKGRYRFRSPDKAEVLSSAMLHAFARARDNEMYVILADLVSLTLEEIQPIIKAIRTARARKHHVLVVVPWPDGLQKPVDIGGPRPLPPKPTLAQITRRSLESGFSNSFADMRRALAAAGATVVRIDKDEPVKMVLDKMDRLRGVRVRR
ncbi:MAG: DUF58 domain-containing protein [Gemmataceae bacterium]